MGREHSGRGPAGISQLKRETRAHVGSPRHFATPRYPPRLGAALENERTRTGECTSVSLDGAHVFFFFTAGEAAELSPARSARRFSQRSDGAASRAAPHRTARRALRGAAPLRPPHCGTATARKEGKSSVPAVPQAAPHAGQQD